MDDSDTRKWQLIRDGSGEVFGSLQIRDHPAQAVWIIIGLPQGAVTWSANPTTKNTALMTMIEFDSVFVVTTNLAGHRFWVFADELPLDPTAFSDQSLAFSTFVVLSPAFSVMFSLVFFVPAFPSLVFAYDLARPWMVYFTSFGIALIFVLSMPCAFSSLLLQAFFWCKFHQPLSAGTGLGLGTAIALTGYRRSAA